MEFENIFYEIRDGVLYLTLDCPEVRSALTPEMWGDISTAVQYARGNDQIRVVIVAKAGGKALANGADVREIHDRDYLKILLGTAPAALKNLEDLCKPVICVIDGYTLGSSYELAMACSIQITTKRSRLGQPEADLGTILGADGIQRLSRLVGLGKARELIYTGKIIATEGAEAIGPVNQVAGNDRDTPMTTAEEMACQIMVKGSVTVTIVKVAINLGYETDINTDLMIERPAQTIASSTEDGKKGAAAFLGERPAQFRGH